MADKILIVEDDEFLRLLLVKKLRNEGFQILEAVDGEDALRKMKENLPELVILDLILPSVDGFQVLERKKEDQEIKNIPVLIVSNLGEKEEVSRSLKLGAIDYIVKSYHTPAEIVEKIKSLFAKNK